MANLFRILIDWSEVWAPILPLMAWAYKKPREAYMRPVLVYLVIAFAINLFGDVVADFKPWLPEALHSNTPLYNIHSIVRFTCFAAFFSRLEQPYYRAVRWVLPLMSVVFVLLNFTFVERFWNKDGISGNLLAAEAFLLLVWCLVYYLSELRSSDDTLFNSADFWVVTGLAIYVVVNFFLFLFYVPMLDYDGDLANSMWDIHNIAYIIFCLFITRSLYVPARHQFAS